MLPCLGRARSRAAPAGTQSRSGRAQGRRQARAVAEKLTSRGWMGREFLPSPVSGGGRGPFRNALTYIRTEYSCSPVSVLNLNGMRFQNPVLPSGSVPRPPGCDVARARVRAGAPPPPVVVGSGSGTPPPLPGGAAYTAGRERRSARGRLRRRTRPRGAAARGRGGHRF